MRSLTLRFNLLRIQILSARSVLHALIAVALAALAHGSMAANDAPLEIALSGREVSVRGAAPHGEVLLVGYERSAATYSRTRHRHRALFTADGAGAVKLSPQSGIRPDSLWIAVDVRSGRLAVSAPDAAQLRHRKIPRIALRRDGSRQVRRYVTRRESAYLIVVRPGEGVWELLAGDGGEGDSDANVNGRMEVSFKDLRPVGESPVAPSNLQENDLLLVFSPEDLTLSSLRLEMER